MARATSSLPVPVSPSTSTVEEVGATCSANPSTFLSQLQPFLDSKNDYVAIRTAVAVIRLGERVKGGDALVRLTKRDPAKHLCYVTAALRFLKELEHPEFRLTLLDALAAVDRDEGIQPNWVSDFLLLAAEIDGNVWAPKAALGAAGAGERK